MASTTVEIDPFDAPEVVEAGSGGMDNPTIKQLSRGCPPVKRKVTYMGEEYSVTTRGRLCLFWVTGKGSETNDDGKEKTRLTVDIAFLDGEPIEAKLDKDGDVKVEYDEPLTAPSNVLKGSWLSNAALVRQLEKALGTGRPRLGRIGQIPPWKPGQDKRYILCDFTAEEKAMAAKYIKAMPILEEEDPLAAGADEDDD